MNRQAIVAEGLSVRFRPYVDRKPTLRKSLGRFRHREVQDVVALDDVTFSVEKGQAFGVIGQNGAGKSTLMRCIAGTLRPNEGQVVVDGKTSTLLQLGVGFIPELSGRRIVFLGGLAAGMKRSEIDERFDEIVEYAELWEAIDRPVKTYSSGMFARLAFSVGMHLDPDVLLLDEVLAVGDENFKTKSMRTMRELLDRSGTIVFVSHTLSSIREFCDSAIWLDNGRIEAQGSSREVVRKYRHSMAERLGPRQ